jgi:spermidine synthase
MRDNREKGKCVQQVQRRANHGLAGMRHFLGGFTAPEIPAVPLISALFFASGFAALSYQIAWQRALFGWYGVDLDSVTAIVSIFMLGLGVGALVGGWLADRFPANRIAVFSVIEMLIALFGFVSLDLIDGMGAAFANQSLPVIVGLTFALFLLPTCAMGATLPVLVTELTARISNVGQSTGQLYYINTLGAAVGAFAAAFALIPLGGLDGLVFTAACVNASISVIAAFAFRPTTATSKAGRSAQ